MSTTTLEVDSNVGGVQAPLTTSIKGKEEYQRLFEKYGEDEKLPPIIKYSIFGGRHLDTKTKNTDFIKMYNILRAKGVKKERCSFFLKVYDAGLIGVDPLDPNLSRDMQKRVIAEVSINFWYFLRECVRFRAPGGSIPCQLNLGNLAYYYSKLMCLDVIIELPRQFGKTGGAALFTLWASMFVLSETEVGMANKSAENLVKDIADMKTIIRNLPSYLRLYDPDDATTGNNNAREIFMRIKNLRIRSFVSGRSQVDANTRARGFSFPLGWLDEAPFMPQFKAFFLAFIPSMSKQKKLAKKNKVVYGLTLSTTSGTLTDPDQNFFKTSLIDNAAPFSVGMFNFTTRLELIEFINRNAGGYKSDDDISVSMVYIRFDYRQLGAGKAYYDQACKDAHYDEDAINKDILLRWVEYSRISPFNRLHIERLDQYADDIKFTLMVDDYYPLNFYRIIRDFDFTYLMCIDISRGGGENSDSSSITIHDPRNLEVVAEFTSNIIDIPQLEFLIVEIGTKIFPNCCIVPEVNGLGNGLVQNLAYNDDIVSRLFHEKMDTSVINKPVIKTYKQLKPIDFGFLSVYTAKNNKMDIMYKDIIADAIAHDFKLLHSRKLIEQIGTLEKNSKTGKIGAALGCHKDNISSFVIGRYALLYSPTITNWIPREHIRKVILDSGHSVYNDETLKKQKIITRNLTRNMGKTKANVIKGRFGKVIDFLKR